MPTPISYPTPPGVKIYTSASDWRTQHPAGPIPTGPGLSRFWSDPAAVKVLSNPGGIPGFPQLNNLTGSPQIFAYAIPVRDPNGYYIRCKIGSPAFYNSYAISMAHNTMVALMKQYAWVYELTGDPVLIETLHLTAEEAAVPNFGSHANYPINLRSDYIFFTQGDELVCLSHADFIEFFKPQNTNTPTEMRKTVLGLAQDTRLSDSQAISMIRLAVQEPKTNTLI